ncbi:DUF4252 domain-containing protein [uncultured Sanguibacteroides sp.]|uniref:DUF4252 domain-containing protein n=1 Tax=uncultured Sanguibacteroides sp. TaxID=1635151 RepID=UPI0025FDAA98|nr:DUF4252 domain-containing protein [uncultured Sanguibacteroides sp.]
MKILNLFMGIMMNIILIFPLQAQIGKEMKAFRNKEGVTVTMLNPSLYGLYKKNDLSLATEEVLKKVEEINVLQIDRQQTKTNVFENIYYRLNSILENESKYNQVQSYRGATGNERLFVTQNDDIITSLVLWKEERNKAIIIELKGDIELNKIHLLANALQVKGIDALTYVNSPEQEEENLLSRHQELLKRFLQDDTFPGDSTMLNGFLRNHQEQLGRMDEMFTRMQEMMQNMGNSFDHRQGMTSGDGFEEFMSNGLEVIQENGKTKIKVNSQNSKIIYLIDGKEFTADSIGNRIPDEIATVNMVRSPEDPRTSYVVINSKQKAGKFISYANGILKFNYENQDYTFNLDKLNEPILIINNQLTGNLDINPADIIQIRPITESESKILGYPSAKVIIVVDKMIFGF